MKNSQPLSPGQYVDAYQELAHAGCEARWVASLRDAVEQLGLGDRRHDDAAHRHSRKSVTHERDVAPDDALISSDADLLVLHPWQGVPVLTPAAFMEQVSQR